MGRNLATELADGTLGQLRLKDQIAIHLRNNLYPPVPLSMLQACLDAIDAYREDNIDYEINLNGNKWRGNDMAPAWAIIEGHRLDVWTTKYDNEEEGA